MGSFHPKHIHFNSVSGARTRTMLESGRCQSEGYTLHLHKEYKSKIEACGKSEGAVCSMRGYEEFSNGNGYPRGVISVTVNYMVM